MAARLYEDDQHPCALRASGVYFVTAFSGLLAHWDPGATGLLVGFDIVHDASTRRARDARIECVPDARGDREHEARLQVGARAPQGGRGHDERGPRDGGARGRGRVRGGAARDAREHRTRVGAQNGVFTLHDGGGAQ